MTKSELISEILSEWAYRVDDGQPNPKNKKHLAELSIVLSEMGLSNIKDELFENLEEEDSKQFSNPLLNKKLKYKNEKGEDKEAPIGNLLRLQKGSPGREAAEKMLPKDGSPERDALNKSLGGEKDGKSQTTPDNTPKGGEDAQQEDPIQKAAVMFDPKVDPAMGARMDTEKNNLAKLAQTDKDKEAEEKADVINKEEDGKFNPIPTQDVNSEMPQADPETFGGNSDIPDGIQPEELHQFNTDIKKVAQIVAKAKENNQPIPDINLCDITVPGTNLYCDDNLGIPRDEMPQFKGKAVAGSRAAAMDADESGEVDTEPVFKQMLQQKGIKTLQTEVPADKLKATQKDLVGGKVIGMMGALEKDPHHPKITAPIYVSRDGYVIDGHHRWAAIVAYNASHPEQQIQMKTTVLDMDIKDAIPMCNQFAEDMGVAAKKADANKETTTSQPTENIAKELKNRKSADGEDLDIETTDKGSMIIGVEHGEGTESTKQTINKIKSLPSDAKVMFVGEGGMSRDDNGNLELAGEQNEIRNAVKGHFKNSEESSWDENANVFDDSSAVYDSVAQSLGGNKSKAKAAIWSNMYGQDGPDSGMDAGDYLDEEGKQWIIDQAKKGGATSINANTDFNNLTDEEQKDLYELNYRDDDGYGETEISKGQQAYNGFRQKELDSKIKEAESKGFTVIAPVGNSHVGMWRQRNKPTQNQANKKEEIKMKQETYSKYQHLLDEVINEIIDEAPVKKDPLEGKKVKYKDSKGREREILVKSALEYDKKHPAYIAAKAFLNQNKSKKQEPAPAAKKLGAGDFRKNPKEKPVAAQQPNPAKSEEPTKVNSIGDAIMANSKQKGDDKKQAFVDKKKDELNKLLGSMGENNKLTLLTEPGGKSITINTLKLGGVIDKVFSGKPLNSEDKKLFNSCLKLVTNPENGDVKIYVAAKYVGRHPQQGYESIKIAQDNVAMGDAIRKYALQNNLNVGKSSEGAIGKKVLTPVKMASAVNPSKPETIIEIKKTANGVTIAGKEMKRLKELDYDGLVKSLTAKYGPEEASKKAKLLVLQTKAYNQKLDDLAKIGESSGGKIPMANFGDVTTPQNRKKTASNVLDGIIKRFESELDNFGKQFGKSDLKNTPENKKVFNSLNTLKALNAKANLETDEKARAQYKATLDQLLLDMANAPDFKDSVADFAEQKAGLQFLAEGKQVYFPASENFQTADIIVMPDEFSVKPKKGQTTEEAIAENLQFYSVTVTYVGGLSVKYKGGGGSANYSKIEQTEYHNPETKARLLDMQNVYSLAYPKDKNGQLNIKDEDVKAANKKIEDTIQWAIKAKLMTKEDADLVRRIGAGQAGNTLKGALKDVAKCKGANRKNFEQAIVLHHTMMHLTAVLNNKDMAYTRFSNFNEEVSQNKDGQATKITDDIADGVNKPCYMNPHHNPGFGTMTDATSGCITGSPTNQNPSHIESEQPKNLLKAPK
jgi:hypothetical protein